MLFTIGRLFTCDDGPGFTPREHDGRGLRNMRDRMEAIGGRLTIDASPGRGTRVVGSVGLPQPQAPAVQTTST